MLPFWVVALGLATTVAALLHGRLMQANALASKAAQIEGEVSALADYRQRLSSIIDNAPALIGYIDAEQRFKFHNLTFEHWLEMGKADITGHTMREVYGEAEYEKLKPHLERALRGGRITFHHEHRLHGEVRHAATSYVPDFDPGGRVRGCFVVAKDIGAIIGEQRDTPDGVASRGQLVERLRRALARNVRSGAQLALLHLGIERWLTIANSLGTPAAEALLGELAERLRACVRATDTVARVGPEQFVVMLEGLKERSDAHRIAEKILQTLRAPIPAGGGEVCVTASIGVAFPPGAEVSPEELIQRAASAPAYNQPPSSFEPMD